jgi:UDP-N-acetylmuramoyl-tripeptide--D-alanyl-D-alanine ligase
MRWHVGEIARILGASFGEPGPIVQGYSIDSRRVRPGDIFFAIRGRRLDGHEFVKPALQSGAVAAVVEQSFEQRIAPSVARALIPVRDTTLALHVLAREARRRWGKKVVAITGSTGKTTTKEMVSTLLAARYRVLKSPGNFNNDYGLPLTLLGLENRHDVAVVELAMSAAGEIARLARVAEPEVGVVTNVGPVHLQYFKSVDDIALAKRELIENLTNPYGPTVAVLNHDDPRVKKFADGYRGRAVTFGRHEGADFVASEILPAGEGTTFRVKGPSLNAMFHVNLPGEHHVENATAAIAVSSLFEIPAEQMVTALHSFKNLPGRSEILTLPGEITVLNDCYNSNPRAMEKMLDTLAAWKQARRRILVAGEMLELGPASAEWHRSIGQKCLASGVDWIVAVQGEARFFLEGARERGFAPSHLRFFETAQEAAEFCRSLVREGDVVLVKGSRDVRLEAVIDTLRNSRPEAPPAPQHASTERNE